MIKPCALWFEREKYYLLEEEEIFETVIEKDGIPIAMKPKLLKFKLHIYSKAQVRAD